MAQFVDLPLDLLPAILQFVVRSNHLAATRLTSHAFNTFAAPLLFEQVSILAWHKNSKLRVKQLFRVLASYPSVAKWVKRLEIRDFPKSYDMESFQEIMSDCRKGIENCTNLQQCAWTRDGSVNKLILDSLLLCQNLHELEINGGHAAHYDAQCLPQFHNMRKITLVMPNATVVNVIPSWIAATGSKLLSLTLMCKSSGLITDDLLESLSPDLTSLEYLNILGCPRVTYRGVWSIISKTVHGIIGLGLENLAHTFDMATFSELCTKANALRRLRTITLTINAIHSTGFPSGWLGYVKALLLPAPLTMFQIYSTSSYFDAAALEAMSDFCSAVVATHGQRLTRFSVHRMRISTQSIIEICHKCPSLEELFLVAHPKEIDSLTKGFARALKLRNLHINYPFEEDPDAEEDDDEYIPPVLSSGEALQIVRRCAPALVEFGCNSRVWKINCVVFRDVTGQLATTPELSSHENPNIPEQFLVVRS